MKPVTGTDSPRTLTRNRMHRRAARRGGKSDSDSESESTTSSGSKSSGNKTKSSGLQKPSANRTTSGSPVVKKSDSASSVQSHRSRSGSNKAEPKSSNTTKPVPGNVAQSATVKKATLRTRTASFNQEENPFFKGIPLSLTAVESATPPRKSVGTPTKSVATDSPINRSKGPKPIEGLAADRRSAYLSAAQSSSGSRNDRTSKRKLGKIESDSEIQELNSIRSSQLVARMKSQFQANSKLRAPTRSATLKRRTERAHTTQILPRSQSSPATSRRSSLVLHTSTASSSSGRKQSTVTKKTSTVQRDNGRSSTVQRKQNAAPPPPPTVQRKQNAAPPPPPPRPPVRESNGANTSLSTANNSNNAAKRTNAIKKRPNSAQKAANSAKSSPSTRPSTAPGLKSSKPEIRPASLKLQSEKQGSKPGSKPTEEKKRRSTRIPSPVKSPPCSGIRTSKSTSRVPQKDNGNMAPKTRPKINSASSRLQQGNGSANRLKNSASSNHLKNSASSNRLKNSASSSKLKNPSKLKNSTSSSRIQDSDVSDCSRSSSPVKHSGRAVKTPRQQSAGFCGRSTSLADLNNATGGGGMIPKPNLNKLQSLSKSTSSVNEKSVRQARREAAQRRAAEVARSRDPDGLEGVQEMSPRTPGADGRTKFVYGGHRSDSRA
ncbi:uncharacterized protein LOC134816520 isoform X2 [Bolinopsis microptera]|uniref:uncharacterized protein LOC134816520 isoform X2 n=1 Tax=Bolinopsis microptera TaxID=2820187 RepID=UPI00307A40A4